MTDIYFTCAQTGRQRNLTQERKRERSRSRAINAASHASKQHEIARICQQYELESDEFFTAEQKARRLLNH